MAGRSWKTISTKHKLFSGRYESHEERDVICRGISSKQQLDITALVSWSYAS